MSASVYDCIGGVVVWQVGVIGMAIEGELEHLRARYVELVSER